MGDSIETDKKLLIAKTLKDLIKTSNQKVSQLNSDKNELEEFVMFAFDDFLNGKQFVGNPTLSLMLSAYGELMGNMNNIMLELNALATIRDDNPATFRANLDSYIQSKGKSLEDIRKKFD